MDTFTVPSRGPLLSRPLPSGRGIPATLYEILWVNSGSPSPLPRAEEAVSLFAFVGA